MLLLYKNKIKYYIKKINWMNVAIVIKKYDEKKIETLMLEKNILM